eukprot:4553399-Prorocentrum_lima.AAC.1
MAISPARSPSGTETFLFLCQASGATILLSAENPFSPVQGGAMTPQTGLHSRMYRQSSCTCCGC